MPHGRHKLHFGRIVWEVLREFHSGLEIAAFKGSILRSVEDDVPLEHIVVILEAHRETRVVVLAKLFQLISQNFLRKSV